LSVCFTCASFAAASSSAHAVGRFPVPGWFNQEVEARFGSVLLTQFREQIDSGVPRGDSPESLAEVRQLHDDLASLAGSGARAMFPALWERLSERNSYSFGL
jgi:hypothetical protein